MRRVVLLLVVVALVACGKETKERWRITGRGDVAKVEVKDQLASPPAFMQAVNRAIPAPPPRQPEAIQRMIIRTATLSMIVDDTALTMDRLKDAAEAAGGYVSDSRVWREGEQLRGSISLRVPSPHLTATLASLRRLAVRIQSESVGSQEVTQEYVDLSSRLRNMEAAEAELRQLMTAMREKSKRASEVLEIYQQLSSIRGDIEQTKGRMRYLSEMTSLATVNVELVPNAIAKPVVEAGWQPLVIVKDASRALVVALQGLASAAIWFAIYLLPIAAMVLVAGFAVWKLLSRAVRRAESVV